MEPHIVTATQLLELMNQVPFEGFEFHLSDGTKIAVEHPYLVATSPHSSFCTVFDLPDRARYVAFRNITEVIAPLLAKTGQ